MPAGLYFVVAKASVHEGIHTRNIDCSLAGGTGSDFSEAYLDLTDTDPPSYVEDLGGGCVGSTMSLQMDTNMGAGGTVTLSCQRVDTQEGYHAYVYSARINAIKVGALH